MDDKTKEYHTSITHLKNEQLLDYLEHTFSVMNSQLIDINKFINEPTENIVQSIVDKEITRLEYQWFYDPMFKTHYSTAINYTKTILKNILF